MKTLETRSYQGENDLEAVAEFFQVCETVDRLDEWVSVSDLRQEFNAPDVDRERDIRLWKNGEGKLIGFGKLSIQEAVDGYFSFRVHPTVRGEGIEQEIIRWGEARMEEVARERDVSVKLRSATRDDKTERIALLESCGFTPKRYFLNMERSLADPLPKPEFPIGFTLKSHSSAQFSGKQEQRHFLEAWVEMYNQTFIDHWNFHEWTVEKLEYKMSYPDYRQYLDLVALTADGTFAAFCICFIHPEDNQRKGTREGQIGDLGTRRGFRKRGLGKAMLLSGMERLQAVGMDKVRLGVDAENPSGANRLYESLGFRKVNTKIIYGKEL
ncbi:MAG: GNAT family N-acetyltransferase [Okeania sp. SIO2G4]|uniref:GNAT family N-acetyltransferase n=1 Tax=unclassified Okeania TaxID=2634635 RepID=UPI0013B9684E|nr:MULTISPECIES: GNAT family N-acetyltransferase [unclassified Okeania]NEP04737.1 GNAT family N-acetyltransferase [Okeania sp. SIO4D6]NEP74315.1 GNAT family N-acetyltransferase [Okeania sp. SIO2G5]NEP96749.1 GNAT family N-acetyltransferase [Okeania sp. SIO2F5]NEQ93126.1 GNAT family N-acetyltransferase [Okeania sp. SIO2G4]